MHDSLTSATWKPLNPIQTRLFETLGRLGLGDCFLRTIRARDLKLGTRNEHDQTNKLTSFAFVYVT